MRWLLGALVGFGFAMLGLAAAQSADADLETVRARGWVHEDEGFARLVFDWTTPVGYSVRIEGDRLIVGFDRPAHFTLSRALGYLAPYIAGVDPASTDRQLVFDLTARWRLRHFTDGSKVAIDLFLPQPAAGGDPAPLTPVAKPFEPTPSTPAAPASAPTPTQTATVPAPPSAGAAAPDGPPPIVRLRVGEHDGFSRLVFDWPSTVGYRVTRSGDSATISFDAPGRLMLDGAVKQMPAIIRDFVAGTDEAHPSITFDLKPGTAIKDFRDGTHLVLDLKSGSATLAGTEAPAEPAAMPPAASAPLNILPDIASPAPASPSSSTTDPAKPIALPAHTTTAADLLADPNATTSMTPAKPAEPAALVEPPATMPTPEPPQPAPAAVPAPATNTTVAMATPATAPLAAPDGTAVVDVAVQASQQPEGFTLRFQWPAPARLALFRRAGALWIVFDQPARFDLAELAALPQTKLGGAQLVSGGPTAAIRLIGSDHLGAMPNLDGNDWVIDFKPRPEGPSSGLGIIQYVDPVAAGGNNRPTPRLQLRPAAPGPALAFVDPEVGDQLVVVPNGRAGEGVAQATVWPGFRLIPTIQGIAIEPHGDGVEVAATDQGITVGVAAAFGPASADIASRASEPAAADGSIVPAVERLFDLSAWRRDGEGTFTEVEAKLTRAVIDTPDNLRDLTRVDLARFYFAHGRTAEAGGLVDLVMHDRQSARSDAELLLISAASNLLIGQPDVARAQLENPTLRAEIEAEPWRGALAATAGEWDAAASDFVTAPTFLADYPQAVRAHLGMQAAEAAIRTLDTVGAAEWIDRLKDDVPDQATVDHLLYLEGLLAQAQGRTNEARDAWEKAVQSKDPETRARAGFALTELLVADGAMDADTAIGKLDHARYEWRDDGLEFRIEHLLAKLQLQTGRTREGLSLMRQLAADYPENPETPTLVKEMTAAFRGFFQTAGNRGVKPFEALALYDEFPELVPAGAEGDAIQQGLAERYLEMDLPDRAAPLLEDQVQHRLQGVDKARVGTRLAQVRMIDGKPELAIKALAETAADDLPPELASERRLIEADALYRLGRAPEALALLADSTDPAAGKLKVRIFWQLKEWKEAAGAIMALLADAKPEGLDADQVDYVQNLAVALTLADDKAGLAGLRQLYGAAMAETPNASAFQLLTTDLEAANAGDLAAKLAGVAALDAFMTDYRKRYVAPAAAAAAPQAATPPAGGTEQTAANTAPAASAAQPAAAPAASTP